MLAWGQRRSGRHGVQPIDEARAATYPPPYPSGWYRLVASDEVPPGHVVRVTGLGREMALFRTRQGRLGAIDAYCPHMGANLARGRVIGSCIECPFHRWRLDTRGGVTSPINTAGTRESEVPRSWEVSDYYGMVVAYHGPSADGETPRPRYELPSIPEIDDEHFVLRGNYDAGTVRVHIMELAENSVDPVHFHTVHGEVRLPWTQIRVPGIRIRHEATWKVGDDDGPVATFTDRASLFFRDREIPRAGASAEVKFFGPGGIVRFVFDVPDLGRMVLLQTQLPVAPLRQRVHFRWFTPRRFPRLVAWYIVGSWISQWRADVPIWESKVYRARPLLTRADGPVLRMRRWYQQFYSPEDRARDPTLSRMAGAVLSPVAGAGR